MYAGGMSLSWAIPSEVWGVLAHRGTQVFFRPAVFLGPRQRFGDGVVFHPAFDLLI